MSKRMASSLALLVIAACAAQAHAQNYAPVNTVPENARIVEIARLPLGSGEPEQEGYAQAQAVFDDVYHVPQYLPGEPTAATIWPRVIAVQCGRAGEDLRCDGYYWSPAMGRAEYLYFTPVVVSRPPAKVNPD